MKAKIKKRFKGMSLVEVIVSLAVVAVMTLLLVQVSAAINKLSVATNNVNRKVADQAPIAEIKDKMAANGGAGTPFLDGVTIDISLVEVAGEGKVTADLYTVEDQSTLVREKAGDLLNMKFFDLHYPDNDDDEATAAPPPAVGDGDDEGGEEPETPETPEEPESGE